MGVWRDLGSLLRWSRAQPRPSLGEGLATAVQSTRDLRDYQDALVSGTVGEHNGVRATALVESARPLPVTGDGPARTELVLVLEVPGQAPQRVAHTAVLPRAVWPGERLPIWALRFEPRRFTIDWG